MGFVVVVLLAVFHRPLILWALNRFGPSLASKAGVALKWQVEGSLWSDLSISAVNANADEPGIKLSLGKLALNYDLGPAWRGDYLNVAKVSSCTTSTPPLTFGTRSPLHPPLPLRSPVICSRRSTCCALKLPTIDLRNINATVLLPDATGRAIDLDLDWPAGKEGLLHIGSIEHPALTKSLHDVTARLALDGTTVHIDALKLPPEIEVEHLRADLSRLTTTRSPPTPRSAAARPNIDVKATANLKTLATDAVIDITHVTEADVARWVRTCLLRRRISTVSTSWPRAIRCTRASSLPPSRCCSPGSRSADYRSDRLTLTTTLQDGQLSVAPLTVEAAGNRVDN